jgi:hypothetical protein
MRSWLQASRVTLACVFLVAASPDAGAECIGTGMRSVFERSKAELIFSGTFTRKEVISRNTGFIEPVTGDGERFLKDQTAFGMRLTFDLRHSWRGPTPKTISIYQVLHPDSTDHWKSNTEYLIFATRVSADERSYLLLGPEDHGFIVLACSGAWLWTPGVEKEIRRALGRGRKPE